jgi:hypothetical protein
MCILHYKIRQKIRVVWLKYRFSSKDPEYESRKTRHLVNTVSLISSVIRNKCWGKVVIRNRPKPLSPTSSPNYLQVSDDASCKLQAPLNVSQLLPDYMVQLKIFTDKRRRRIFVSQTKRPTDVSAPSPVLLEELIH